MKKFIIFIFGCIIFFPMGTIYAQNHVGIILSGYEKDCQLTHTGKTYLCGDRKQLYIGDIINKKPSVNMLKIKWAPYANGVPRSETSMEIVSSQTEKFKASTYTAGLKQYINDFVKPVEHVAVPLVTRGRKQKEQFPLQATLMRNYPIIISGANEDVKSIAIINTKGQKVYEKPIKSKEAISLVPSEIGVEPLESYTVYINKDTVKRRLDIVLMDEATQEEVLKGLMVIDNENIAIPDSLIRKAVYFQLISDANPDKIDLYWLSHQLLKENTSQFTKDQGDIIRELEKRYYNHYRK